MHTISDGDSYINEEANSLVHWFKAHLHLLWLLMNLLTPRVTMNQPILLLLRAGVLLQRTIYRYAV